MTSREPNAQSLDMGVPGVFNSYQCEGGISAAREVDSLTFNWFNEELICQAPVAGAVQNVLKFTEVSFFIRIINVKHYVIRIDQNLNTRFKDFSDAKKVQQEQERRKDAPLWDTSRTAGNARRETLPTNAYMPIGGKSVYPALGFTTNAIGESLRIERIVGSFNVKAESRNK